MGRCLGIIGQNPSVYESKQLHVVIFWFFFIGCRCISWIPLKCLVTFVKCGTPTGYSLKLKRFTCIYTKMWYFVSYGI